MRQETHFMLTKITAYSTLISGLLWLSYMFTAFLLGRTVTFEEPNLVVASIELLWAAIVLLLAFKYFHADMSFPRNSA